ncbi:hypothetical protein HDV00_007240 [Rhizophlyctis rosea]|nr:hypothetical protein HDV00_007240 [Rhizophlyctis rosea]
MNVTFFKLSAPSASRRVSLAGTHTATRTFLTPLTRLALVRPYSSAPSPADEGKLIPHSPFPPKPNIPPKPALKSRLKIDLKTSMQQKDKARTTVIKSVLADILNAEKSAAAPVPSISTLIQRSLKKRRDAIQQYRDGGREDLAEKEEGEVAILEGYLPKQLSDEEIATIVKGIAEKIGAKSVKDLGKVMKEVGGQVDDSVAPKKVVSEVAKRVLQELFA